MRVDPTYLSKLSSSLSASTAQEAELTAELSSGLRVSSLSTDPTITAQSTLLNTGISQQDTYVQLAATETGRLQVADSALSETVTQLTSAISLATQAANGTVNAANLSAIKQEVSGIRDTVLSLANTNYTGTYLFSGSKGTTQPFALNTATDPATFTYSGDNNLQSIVTPGGQSIAVGVPGTSLFGSALTALNSLVSDLNAGNTANVSQDAATVSSALTQLSGQRTVISNSLARLSDTSSYAQNQESSLKITQSSLVSADTAQVATSLSQAETQNQALISVIAALGKNSSLFSYIQ